MTTPKPLLDEITHDPQMAGGKATIRGTRVTVADIVARHDGCGTTRETAQSFRAITEEQVLAALAYYASYPAEIDAVFAMYEALDAEKDEPAVRAQPNQRGQSSGMPTHAS